MSDYNQYEDFFEAIQENFERLVRCNETAELPYQAIFAFIKDPKNKVFVDELAEGVSIAIYNEVLIKLKSE